MGIPLRVTEVPGTDPPESGYLVRRDEYVLRDPGLEPDEVAALQLALAAVHLDGSAATEALWKLGGAEAADPQAAPLAAIPTVPGLVPLFGAVAEQAAVRFAYRGEPRHVDPHRLSYSRGHWYLDGHDHDRGAERQFRVDRIDGDVTVGPPGTFERPTRAVDRSAAPWELGGDDPIVARVLVDPPLAEWAGALPEGGTAERNDDGSLLLTLTVTNREGFRSFVLGFLDHAEVVDPPELRRDVVDWLTALAG
jgi:predicted DNA-binding transcriptional regulator YafY